jgi:hypothetical protein
MTAPTTESALLVSARQLADEARERRRVVPARQRRPAADGIRYGSGMRPG